MEIVIHGTKHGKNTFTNTDAVVRDVRPQSYKGNALGSTAFNISYKNNNEIHFEKNKIIIDDAAQKMGYIGFTLVIPNSKILEGKYIIEILNKLEEIYKKREYIDKYDNLREVREDFDFIDTLKEKYSSFLKPNKSNSSYISNNNNEAAYIYYNSKEELANYFNAPYQREYEKYKQVFFVDAKYRNQEDNPLNGLRHANGMDITSKINLDNYELVSFSGYANDKIKISVHANGRNIKAGDNIDANDKIEVEYSKEYYTPKNASGIINNQGDLAQFIEVLPHHKFTFIKDVSLDPRKEKIELIIKNWEGSNVRDVFFKLTSGRSDKKVIDNKVEFIAEEIGEEWTLTGEVKNEKLRGEVKFKLEKYKDGKVELILNKEIELKFKNAINTSVTLNKQNDSVNKKNDSLFIIQNKAIDQEHEFKIEREGYKTKTIKITPNEYLNKTVQYEDLEKQVFEITIGKGGEEHGSTFTSNFKDGRDVKNHLKAKRGYKFIGFAPPNENQLEAQFKKIPFYKKPLFIGSLAGILVLGIGVFFISKDSSSPTNGPEIESQEPSNELQTYLDGDSLMLERLEEFSSNNEIDDKSLKDLLKKITSFRNDVDSGKINSLKHLDTNDYANSAIKDLIGEIKPLNSKNQDELSKLMNQDRISNLPLSDVIKYVKEYEKLKNFNLNDDVAVKQLQSEKEKINEYFKFLENQNGFDSIITLKEEAVKALDERIKELEERDRDSNRKMEEEKTNESFQNSVNVNQESNRNKPDEYRHNQNNGSNLNDDENTGL